MRSQALRFTGLALLLPLAGTVGAVARPAPLPPSPPRVLPTAREGAHIVNGVGFSPNGATLLVEGEVVTPEGTTSLSLWDTGTGRHLVTVRGEPPRDRVRCGTFSPDGKVLAHVEQEGSGAHATVVLRELPGGRVLHRLSAPGQPFFSPDGRRLTVPHWSSDGDNDLTLWDVASGQLVARPRRGNGERLGRPFSLGGEVVFHSSLGVLRAVDVTSGVEREPRRIEAGVHPEWAGPPGTVVCIGADGRPRLVETWSGKTVRTFDVEPPGKEKWHGYAISADGRRLLRNVGITRLVSFDTATGKAVATFGVPGHPAAEFVYTWFSPDGRFVVAKWQEDSRVGGTRYVHWNAVLTADGRMLRKDRGVTALGFDRAMRSVVVVSGNNCGGENDPPAIVTIHDATAWLAGEGR